MQTACIFISVLVLTFSFVAVFTIQNFEKENRKTRVLYGSLVFLCGLVSALLFALIPSLLMDAKIICGLCIMVGFIIMFLLLFSNYEFSPKLYLILVLYAAFITWLTLSTRFGTSVHIIRINPAKGFSILFTSGAIAFTRQFCFNILLFIPFGFLLRHASGRNFLHCFAIACILSGIIEGTQLILGLGQCDVLDIISNCLGALIGFIISAVVVSKSKNRDPESVNHKATNNH